MAPKSGHAIFLSKRSIDKIKPVPDQRLEIPDTMIRALRLRIEPDGKKVFSMRYRDATGAMRRTTLGTYGVDMTAEQARDKAKKIVEAVRDGGNPSVEKRDARRGGDIKVVDLAERYLNEYSTPRKSPASVKSEKSILNRQVLPTIGHMRVAAVTKAEIAAMHGKLGAEGRQSYGNRMLACVQTMFRFAEEVGLRREGTNPAKGVRQFAEKPATRYLTMDELQRLGVAIRDAEQNATEPRAALLAICLLAMTGLRKSEVLSLRWQEVDLDQGFLVLARSKTGGRAVLLGGAALKVLEQAHNNRESEDWVCPGRHGMKPFDGLRRVWMRLCESAKIKGATLHTLRHSFATAGVAQQISVQVVGSLLGHRQISTSMRYSHIADDPARVAADKISSRIATALEIAHEVVNEGYTEPKTKEKSQVLKK